MSRLWAPEGEVAASSPVITAGEADSPGQVQQSLSDPAAGGEQGGTESPEGVPSGELFPADQGMAQAEAVSGEQAAAASSGRVVDPSRPMVALTFDDGPSPL